MMDRCPPLRLAEPGFQDPAPLLKPTSITSKTKPAAATSTEDAELEKRKARAARFGIPLVESKRPASTTETSEKQLPDVCKTPVQTLAMYLFYFLGPGEAEGKGRTFRHRNKFG